MSPSRLHIGSIVIRVDDLEKQAAFWEAALGYRRRPEPDDTSQMLVPPDGIGPNVNLDVRPAIAQARPRIHLDLYANDQAAEVDRLLALGATKVDWTPPPGADFVVMADPEGNRFCVIDKGA
ncbi:MAG TPA: VOC family protein [Candidatus Limnocylindrales bacterium]|nr:VOC family protein [Candidatus Limnocylindrales bacterium]